MQVGIIIQTSYILQYLLDLSFSQGQSIRSLGRAPLHALLGPPCKTIEDIFIYKWGLNGRREGLYTGRFYGLYVVLASYSNALKDHLDERFTNKYELEWFVRL